VWYSCAVVTDAWIPDEMLLEPVQFASGVRLEKIPSWVKDEPALRFESWQTREAVKKARAVFATEYEANALGSEDPSPMKHPRGIQAAADAKIALAQLALWIVRPCSWSGGPLLHFGEKGNAESLRQSGSLQKIRVADTEIDAVPSSNDFTDARALHAAMLGLGFESTWWAALRMLQIAATEHLWEVRYMLMWVVLEALFGPADGREITFRISQRIALFLGNDTAERIKLFDSARECYGTRSKAVHGAKLASLTPERSSELMLATEALVRSALRKVLPDQALCDTFSGKAREAFLDGLAFR